MNKTLHILAKSTAALLLLAPLAAPAQSGRPKGKPAPATPPAPAATTPAPAAPDATSKEAQADKVAIEGSPEQKMDMAQHLYSIGRFDKTLDIINSIPSPQADTADVRFLKANSLAQLKRWDDSRVIYEDLAKNLNDEKDGKWTMVRFNLAEIYYVLTKYEESHRVFTEIYSKIEGSEKDKARATQFIRYKLFLNDIQLKHTEEAAKWMATFSEFDDTPAWYYATAATAFTANNPDEGWEMVNSARRIYNEQLNATFFDGIYEGGFVAKDDTVDKPNPNAAVLQKP